PGDQQGHGQLRAEPAQTLQQPAQVELALRAPADDPRRVRPWGPDRRRRPLRLGGREPRAPLRLEATASLRGQALAGVTRPPCGAALERVALGRGGTLARD